MALRRTGHRIVCGTFKARIDSTPCPCSPTPRTSRKSKPSAWATPTAGRSATAPLRSWRRCIDSHRLDPAHTSEAHIVTEGQLRAHREESEPLIHIARHALERLYQQLKGLDYVLLLADRHGVAVDFLGHEADKGDLRRAGLYLGAQWREDHSGTSAVGACLETGEALTVHQSDHFDFTHTGLSCTAAPIYDMRGELAAVLDLSLLRSPAERASQNLALNLVMAAARRVEQANLMAQSGQDWVVRLAQSPDFLDVDPDASISVDARGRIRAMTHAGARLLAAAAQLDWRQRKSLIGQPLERFFDVDLRHLSELRRNRPAQERIIRARDGSILFAHAMEPQRRTRRLQAQARPAQPLPAALQALDTGDAALQTLLRKAARLAPQELPVLVQGDRRGQGIPGPRAACIQRPQRRLHCHQLRSHSRGTAGERAVRLPARNLDRRRQQGPRRADCCSTRGHAVP